MTRATDFWSRRKAGVEAEARALEDAATPAPEDETRSDEDVLSELNLVAPEELETTEAIKDFLKHDLPERLKTRALRQLWKSNPVLANLDGLVDYGEDFTDAATVMEKMETVYQVGKGMMTAFLSEEAADEVAPESESENEEDSIYIDTAEQPLLAVHLADERLQVFEENPPVAAPPRRMRFAFENA